MPVRASGPRFRYGSTHDHMDTFKGTLFVDLETCSAEDIKQGAWAYSAHPSTRVWSVVFSYAEHAALDGEVYEYHRIDPGGVLPALGLRRTLPVDIEVFIQGGGRIVAHNVAFEKCVWRNILTPVFGWPEPELEQWRDTQAMAAAVNLPLSLDGVATALGCPIQKDAEGAKVMKKLARVKVRNDAGRLVHADGTEDPSQWVYPEPTAEEQRTLVSYNCDDVGAMADCFYRLPALSVDEHRLWLIDQRINERGVCLDAPFAEKLKRMARKRAAELTEMAHLASGCELKNSTVTTHLKDWLIQRGVELPMESRKRKNPKPGESTYYKSPTCDAAAVAALLERADLPPDVRRVLHCRQEANKATSLAKLNRVDTMTTGDNRLRFALRYCKAHTGRWASSGLQLHNLAKNKLDKHERELALMLCEAENLDGLSILDGEPLSILSQQLRSVLVAGPGKELIAADYSAIEARAIAWLSGHEHLTQMFRDGVDVYVAASDAIGLNSRQLGKVVVLGLGYGMGALKFITTAADWGFVIPPKEAKRIVKTWRTINAPIVAFWDALSDAVFNAILNVGEEFHAGRHITARSDGGCLYVRLPSGRSLRYWRPAIVQRKRTMQFLDDEGHVVSREMEVTEIEFWKADGRTMVRDTTYGGKLAENVTQAVARDLLGHSLRVLEPIDTYDVVVHVHDSIAAEVEAGSGDVSEFERLLELTPDWARGCPVAAEGYRGRRFAG